MYLQRTHVLNGNRLTCIAMLMILGALGATAPGASQDQVHASINRAKEFLYKSQGPDGLWEYPGLQHEANGGLTAVATYALLASGENFQNPRLTKALEFLKKLKSNNVYVLGTRAQIWAYLGEGREVHALVAEDAKRIAGLMKTAGEARGLFYYPQGPPDQYDHSISQYGVLGLWALAQDGAEIGMRVFDTMDQAWRKHQSPAGGWAYITKGGGDQGDDTIAMTCAGVATLFITHDYVHAAEERGCNGNEKDANLERGMAWIAQHFDDIFTDNPGRDQFARFYTLYGIERIGVAAGYKYFGNIDWFARGADYTVSHQNPDGSFGNPGDMWGLNVGNIPDSAFGILFLCNGNAPVVIDKLVYKSLPPGKGNEPEAGGWNQRPRDLFNLSHWMSRNVEAPLQWNIVTLQTPLPELHEAPVLFIAGSMPVTFNDADLTKLRLFVEEGGLILANADCGNKLFSDSIKAACAKMFPSYEFRQLPDNHVIYTGEQFHADKWKNKPGLLGLTNGVRELVLLAPDRDPSRVWQVPFQGSHGPFGLGADIIEYATERTGLREKRPNRLVEVDPGVHTDRSLRVARLSYDGNWDPEPGGWRRMAAINHNVDKIDVQFDVIKLGEGKLNASANKLATLTGTADVRFNDAQWSEIKNFVNGGGTLLIDAAGGSTEFGAAMEAGLKAAFGSAADALNAPIPNDDPIYPPGLLNAPIYRPFAQRVVGKMQSSRLRIMRINNRLGVVFSREDLTNALVGADVDGVVGYTPDAATHIVGMTVLNVMAH